VDRLDVRSLERSVDREHARADDERAQIQKDEGDDRADRPLVDGHPVEADGLDEVGMNGEARLTA